MLAWVGAEARRELFLLPGVRARANKAHAKMTVLMTSSFFMLCAKRKPHLERQLVGALISSGPNREADNPVLPQTFNGKAAQIVMRRLRFGQVPFSACVN